MPRRLWIDQLLERAAKAEAKEIRLTVSRPPMMYVDRNFVRMCDDNLTADDVRNHIRSITPDENQRVLAREGQTQFNFQFGDIGRCFARIVTSGDEMDIRIRPIWRYGSE